MEEKKNKKKYILITLGVIGTILLVVGITYAYWILTRQQEGTNVVNTACLSVDIESELDDITLDKAYPISDTEGESLKPYKFSVHNKCSDMATYQINLESLSKVLEDNRLSPNYLKVKLNEVGEEGIKSVLGDLRITDTTIKDTYEAHKLMSGYLEPNDTKNFELRIWLHENVTVENKDSMNKEFRSKVTVTSTYIEEDDVPPTSELALSVCENTITATATATPYKDKSIQKYEYQIDEGGWQDGNETQEFPEQLEGDHTVKLRVTDNLGAVSEEVEQTVNIGTPEMVEIAGKQIEVVSCKNGLYKVEHNDLEELGQEWNKTEYRYAGVNYTDESTPYVHNYVSFNNEIWRIIGLVNVKVGNSVEQRVKIVRTDGVGEQKDFGLYAWDRIGSGYSNNWTTSKLKDMLNGIYYESSTGECYTGSSGSTASENTCDFNTGTELPKGLDETARNMIDTDVIWTLGGTFSYTNESNGLVKHWYEYERGTRTGSSNTYPSEWSSTTDEGGKFNGIGLIYPSDYGYATNGGSLGRETCFAKELFNWNSEEGYYQSECGGTDWLKPSSGYLWTLSPRSSSSTVAFGVDSSGSVSNLSVRTARGVEPVGYLTKNVTITSGDGSYEQPYQLQLNA